MFVSVLESGNGNGNGLGWDPFGFLLFLQHLTLIWFFAKLSWHFSPGLFVFLGIQQGFLKQGSKAVRGVPCCFCMQCTINSQLAFCFENVRGILGGSRVLNAHIHLNSLPNQR